MSVGKTLRQSAKDFKEIVFPQIKHWFGEGNLIPVETVTESEMAQQLDMLAGIDAWYIENNKGIRGIGSRVQWGSNHRTFTIRKNKYNGIRTEYEKLKNAVKNDWLYPYWFCQSYLTKKSGKLLSIALCQTKDLVNFIEVENPSIIDNKTDAYFYAVKWRNFARLYPILMKGQSLLTGSKLF